MSVVIDADGHVEEDLVALVRAIPEAMRDQALQFVAEADGHVTYRIEGKLWRSKYPFPGGLKNHVNAGGERREGGRDPKVRIEVMDDEGIDVAVLYPSVGMMFGLHENPDIAAALCVAYNDWLASYCATDPDRLVGVALLPQHEPRLAAAELRRSVTEHGFVAGVMRPNKIGGRTVDHPDFDVLWATAQDLDVPVGLHEAYLSGIDTVGMDRMPSYAGAHVISHVFEQMTGMLVVTLAGIFERFPQLRMGFLEAGCGWAPTWVDRIEEHYELSPDDFPGGDPKGVINSRSWLTFEIEEPGLAAALDLGWADNVMFASDYPHHDAVYPGAIKEVRERGLPEDQERKVLGDNALGYYGPRLQAIVDRRS
ncbi:MAG TPA: amidohydrolase family protein [Acidimicrobiales bacterium]|nr:amidohydrolase family protein [Acidimicrobiales bacterium]